MWYIRFLSGPLAGKTLPLKPGRNTLGRSSHCEVVVPSQGISKEHATIEVYNDKIIVTDLDSRNGTFINGVQIQAHRLQAGEKLAFFDNIAEIGRKVRSTPRPAAAYQGNLAYNQNANSHLDSLQDSQHLHAHDAQAIPAKPTSLPAHGLWSYFMKYVDEVALPGVYKLTEWMEFRLVLGLFVGVFVLLVTALSTVPLMRILKSSIEKEAQNRAQTIARSLARDNRNSIMQGQMSLVSVENARNEPGVTGAYVLSNVNGDIIAPANLAGQYLTDIPFVNEARKSNNEEVAQVNDTSIVAVAPIRFYNSSTGGDSTPAHSVIVYNMGTLAVDDGRTISLFVQILFIAVLLGGTLYFFMYKVIQHPLVELNKQVNEALRSGHTQIALHHEYPELQQLVTNINSAINRSGGGFAGNDLQNFEPDRSFEMQNLINMVGFAAITVNPNDRIVTAVNEHFMNQVGQTGNWIHLKVDQILDQALKLNIQGLIDRVSATPEQMATDHLEISNHNYEITAQGIQGSKGLAYILITFIERGGIG